MDLVTFDATNKIFQIPDLVKGVKDDAAAGLFSLLNSDDIATTADDVIFKLTKAEDSVKSPAAYLAAKKKDLEDNIKEIKVAALKEYAKYSAAAGGTIPTSVKLKLVRDMLRTEIKRALTLNELTYPADPTTSALEYVKREKLKEAELSEQIASQIMADALPSSGQK
jgi:hypothetical protein